MKVLDLGCGGSKTPEALGVDRVGFEGVDLVHDLDRFPYPLESNTFDKIVARHIVEHLVDVPSFFNEIARVAKPGAEVEIVTPHFSNRSAYADPTHRHAFSVRFLDFFCGTKPRDLTFSSKVAQKLFEHRFSFEPFQSPAQFEIQRLSLTFATIFRSLGVSHLANHHLDFYEFYLAFMFPARDIEASLRVVGDDQ
jgi:ubiquinone/menaquinone biosynthesis C-methylase UbiE